MSFEDCEGQAGIANDDSSLQEAASLACPWELQMKILELLPSNDLARESFICKELHYPVLQ